MIGLDSAAHVGQVLTWGIIGAVVLRAAFIYAGAEIPLLPAITPLTGVALIAQFHWLLALFGAFLVYTGARV